MANAEILRCIRKNIGYVCADGFSSSAGILVNIVELAKVQILQNAQSVWMWVGVFAIHFWIDLEIAEFLSSPALFGKEHRPRRRGLKARSNASLSLVPLASCCRSRFGVAFCFREYFGSSKAAATAGLSVAKTATSCAGVKRLHQRNQRFSSCVKSREYT